MTASSREQRYARACLHIPGGVNSPVRAFGSVGGVPRFMARGQGAYVWDADGQRYIDYVGSWGPLIVGHAHPHVLSQVQAALSQGLSFGAPTEAEIELAERLCQLLPSMDMVRMVNSGTEATMTAIRLARGATGRDILVKFEGCYHGHADALLVKAGSGALTLGQPSSAGVPAAVSQHTVVLPYNDVPALEAAFAELGSKIAAVIVEPVAGNMNLVAPLPEFLPALRRLCDQHGSVLIFDEVMTGFRVGLQSAQGRYGITPDLTTLGKVIGGGMPLGALGGKSSLMRCLAPLGPVYQAGTLSGNPVAVAAGMATLDLITAPDFYPQLEAKTQTLVQGLNALGQKLAVPVCAQAVGGMFGLYMAPTPPQTYAEVMAMNKTAFNQLFHAMLEQGVYLAPSAYEAGFVSMAHGNADLEATLLGAEQVLQRMQDQGWPQN